MLGEGERESVGHGVMARSCLGFKMIHQSVSAFIGENTVTCSYTDARGVGNVIEMCA